MGKKNSIDSTYEIAMLAQFARFSLDVCYGVETRMPPNALIHSRTFIKDCPFTIKVCTSLMAKSCLLKTLHADEHNHEISEVSS